jgi:Tfp pilus assembly protein PilO
MSMDFLARQLREPYGPLVPWVAFCCALALVWLGLHQIVWASADRRKMELEAEWVAARHRLVQHTEGQKARQDLNVVLAELPSERDFAPLALGITEEAKKDGVTLPSLSYQTEKTPVSRMTKGVLQGSLSGRYENLRRLIYDLETAEELLFIEDLNLVRSGNQGGHSLTFNIKIGTYLRGETNQTAAP